MPQKEYYNPQDDVVQIKGGQRIKVKPYDMYAQMHKGPQISAKPTTHTKEPPTATQTSAPQGSLSLRFDGQNLTLIHKEEGKTTEYAFPAVSGKPAEDGSFDYSPERQYVKNQGPIPEGKHSVDLSTTTYWKDLDYKNRIASLLSPIAEKVGIGKKGSLPGGKIPWGPGRISVNLDPKVAADTERTGITIHGGYFPGSAGCIDLVNHAQSFFDKVDELKGKQEKIPLIVDYSKTPKKVWWKDSKK